MFRNKIEINSLATCKIYCFENKAENLEREIILFAFEKLNQDCKELAINTGIPYTHLITWLNHTKDGIKKRRALKKKSNSAAKKPNSDIRHLGPENKPLISEYLKEIGWDQKPQDSIENKLYIAVDYIKNVKTWTEGCFKKNKCSREEYETSLNDMLKPIREAEKKRKRDDSPVQDEIPKPKRTRITLAVNGELPKPKNVPENMTHLVNKFWMFGRVVNLVMLEEQTMIDDAAKDLLKFKNVSS